MEEEGAPVGDEPLSTEAERARKAVGAADERRTPRADAAFRTRLREDFTSGRIAGAPAGVADQARPPDRRRSWLPVPAWRAVALAGAAAALILVAGLLNQGERWTVMPGDDGTVAPGVVDIDGVTVRTTDIVTLAAQIKPGAEIRMLEGGPLRLMSGDAVALELPQGVEFTLPPPPPRWVERVSELHSRMGELRITTGPSFRGSRLSVHTAEAVVELTGTTVAVIRDEHGTCVCVLDGRVRMGPAPGPGGDTDPNGPDQAMATIPAGVRCLMFREVRAPLLEPVSDAERGKLSAFRDAAGGMMGVGK